MLDKGLVGLIFFGLCASPLPAQQRLGTARPLPEANPSAASFNSLPANVSSDFALSASNGPQNSRTNVLGGSNWIESLTVTPDHASVAGEISSIACAELREPELTGTPGGGAPEQQPLISRAMVKEAFTREHMVMMAHDFVPGQPLPDAPSYVPLTSRQKFEGWAKHTYSADMFLGTMFDTLILQASGAWPEYGGGMGGFGKRYGTQLISAESWSLFGSWLFPTLLHQDPRYFPSGSKNAFDRMAYAASRAIITRSDDGRNVFNSSLFLTLLISSALSNGYKPLHDKSFPATMENAAAGLGAVAQVNLLNEFWPDLKSLFARHEPGKVKDMRESTADKWDDFSSAHLSKNKQ